MSIAINYLRAKKNKMPSANKPAASDIGSSEDANKGGFGTIKKPAPSVPASDKPKESDFGTIKEVDRSNEPPMKDIRNPASIAAIEIAAKKAKKMEQSGELRDQLEDKMEEDLKKMSPSDLKEYAKLLKKQKPSK